MAKIAKNQWPTGHTPDDFKCCGPAATKDGGFDGTMLADLGCFTQDGKDSNKYYHGAVVQSKKNSNWYAYFEYGRTGVTNPGIQFIEGPSQSAAQAAYEKQMHAKNDKRGEWVQHKVFGSILQAKPGKDCYLVRPQATRSTGLPDAKTITTVNSKVTTNKGGSSLDKVADKLIRDLNVGTMEYTRASLSTSSLPTLDTLDEARLICGEATKLVNKLGVKAEQSKDLEDLTNMLYSRIPKYKNRSKDKSTWLLTGENITSWLNDLDAFETALKGLDAGVSVNTLPFNLETLDPASKVGQLMYRWAEGATRNVHGYLRGKMRIANIWKITKDTDWTRFDKRLQYLETQPINNRSQPLHQITREDIDNPLIPRYSKTATAMLFHGTRTVNVGGILRESFRLPKELSKVAINGAMFGSGTYFADDWKKSAGYTSMNNSIWSKGSGGIASRKAFMFVADVALGQMFTPRGPQGFNGPPAGHHSIFADGGNSGVANNEFILFDMSSIYLRYLVEFEA